eukprot:1146559-Pelagomonas_calceolata.AAC.7
MAYQRNATSSTCIPRAQGYSTSHPPSSLYRNEQAVIFSKHLQSIFGTEQSDSMVAKQYASWFAWEP